MEGCNCGGGKKPHLLPNPSRNKPIHHSEHEKISFTSRWDGDYVNPHITTTNFILYALYSMYSENIKKLAPEEGFAETRRARAFQWPI